MTNLPDAKAKQLPVSGSTSLGSPLATQAPKTMKKDGTFVERSGVAPPRAAAPARPTIGTATKKVAKQATRSTARKAGAKSAARNVVVAKPAAPA